MTNGNSDLTMKNVALWLMLGFMAGSLLYSVIRFAVAFLFALFG